MSNQLGVAVKNSIISLKDRGYSNREIGRMLGICRNTVNKHVKNHYATEHQPNPPAGASVQAPPGFSGPRSLGQRKQFIVGSLVESKRKCGNKNCRCAQGGEMSRKKLLTPGM